MFKIIYPNAKDFFSFINSITKVTDSIILNFTEDGIFSRHLTEDKVLMAIIRIPKDVLSEYSIDSPTSVKLDVSSVKKILSKARSKKATIELSETDSGLKIIIRDEKSGAKSTIYLKAEKGQVEQLTEPKVNLTVNFTTDESILNVIAADVSLVGEEMRISTEEDKVKIEAGEEGKKYVALLMKDKPLKELSIDASATSSYSAEMFKDAITGARGFSAPTMVSFGENLPMKIDVEAVSGGHMIFWIAPRL
ncbi:DNA polymerase sliding clamp [Saccharolobus islandicus]|uniref:DNA polymerase sliding clamp n=1 Tax=Saccharolobus islandicus (strain M.16.4 / Kamchatka \|nr:DNA polymerase sliding clamp [Sulfolobus islandicus]ACR42357.1 proliferating cell nuclear antigen protein-like protein [Sulfolobus islandicus M.16.4]